MTEFAAEPPREPALKARYHARTARARLSDSGLALQEATELASLLTAHAATAVDLPDGPDRDEFMEAGAGLRRSFYEAGTLATLHQLDAIAHALTGIALVETGAVIPPRRHWSPAWHEGRES